MNVANLQRLIPFFVGLGITSAISPALSAQTVEDKGAEEEVESDTPTPGQGASPEDQRASPSGASTGPGGEQPADRAVVYPLRAAYELETNLEARGAPIEEDREAPEFGGPEEVTTAGDVLVWVPRVMLFPLYVVTDFVVRRPLGFIVENIEEHHVIPRIIDATTFGDREGNGFNGGILPRLRLERQMRPAVGLEVYLRDTLFPNNDWTVGADTDFRYNVTVDGGTSLSSRNDRLTAGVHGSFHRDGDLVFTGIGPAVDAETERRFARDRLGGGLFAQYLPNVPGVGGRVGATLAQNTFGCAPQDDSDVDICGPDGTLGTTDDRRLLTGPDGLAYFASGYDLVSLGLDVFADTREHRPRPGTGVRGALFGDWGHGLGTSSTVHFVRHGAEIAGFLDIYRQRVLGLRLVGELAHPVGESAIPFTELSTLGGHELMRGFLTGTFRGRSSLAATLEYRYPVWSFFDGSIFYEVGNVYGELFEGFDPGSLRSSFGLGFRTVQSRNLSLDLLFALGTSRFDEQFSVDTARLTFGTTWGF